MTNIFLNSIIVIFDNLNVIFNYFLFFINYLNFRFCDYSVFNSINFLNDIIDYLFIIFNIYFENFIDLCNKIVTCFN